MLFISQGNILVDQNHHARIADFGLTVLSGSSNPKPHTQGGTVRWMGPELFDSELKDHRPTKYSDCYALGMVIYEVLSLHIPFHQYRILVVSGKVVRGDRPERPQGADGVWFTDDVWEMLGCCWVPEPRNRPSIEDVLRCLEEVLASWRPPSRQFSVICLAACSLQWNYRPNNYRKHRYKWGLLPLSDSNTSVCGET